MKFSLEKNLKQSIQYLKKEELPKPESAKILFTGLDDAGKTSIILALQREFSKIAVLSPTRGAQRRIFDFLGNVPLGLAFLYHTTLTDTVTSTQKKIEFLKFPYSPAISVDS